MKKLFALCLFAAILCNASDSGFKVAYIGGSISDLKSGASLRLVVESGQIRLVKDKKDVISIPSPSVTDITLGRDSAPNTAQRTASIFGRALTGGHSDTVPVEVRNYYISLTWNDHGNRGGVSFHVNASDYRGILAGLEGVTGKKATDPEAPAQPVDVHETIRVVR